MSSFTVISLDFFNEDTTVMEGVVLDVCVIITNGSNQLPNLVTAEIVAFPFSKAVMYEYTTIISMYIHSLFSFSLCSNLSFYLVCFVQV